MDICRHCNYKALSDFDLEAHTDYSHPYTMNPDISEINATNDVSLNANTIITEKEGKTNLKRKRKREEDKNNKVSKQTKSTKSNKETEQQTHICSFCGDQLVSEYDLSCHEDKFHIMFEDDTQQEQQDKEHFKKKTFVVRYSNQTSETSKVTNKKLTEKSEQKEMSSVIDVTTLNQGQNKKRKGKLNMKESNPKRAKSLKVTAHLEDREEEETGNKQKNGDEDEEEKIDDSNNKEVKENPTREDNVEKEGLEGFELVTFEDERCRFVTFLERERISKEQKQKGEEDIEQKANEQKQKEEEDRDKQANKQKQKDREEQERVLKEQHQLHQKKQQERVLKKKKEKEEKERVLKEEKDQKEQERVIIMRPTKRLCPNQYQVHPPKPNGKKQKLFIIDQQQEKVEFKKFVKQQKLLQQQKLVQQQKHVQQQNLSQHIPDVPDIPHNSGQYDDNNELQSTDYEHIEKQRLQQLPQKQKEDRDIEANKQQQKEKEQEKVSKEEKDQKEQERVLKEKKEKEKKEQQQPQEQQLQQQNQPKEEEDVEQQQKKHQTKKEQHLEMIKQRKIFKQERHQLHQKKQQENKLQRQEQKRQIQREQKSQHKPSKFEYPCHHCLKSFVIGKPFELHIKLDHADNKLEYLNNPISMKRQMDKQKIDLDYMMRLETAQTAIINDQRYDKAKKFFLKTKNFGVQPDEVQKALVNIINNLEIVKIKQTGKRGGNVFEVIFSETTDIENVFAVLKDHCESHPEKSVYKSVANATLIKVLMLEKIGEKAIDKSKKETFDINFVDFIPILIIHQKRENLNLKLKYNFPEAIQTYWQIMQEESFQTEKDMCKKFQINGAAKNQFVLLG